MDEAKRRFATAGVCPESLERRAGGVSREVKSIGSCEVSVRRHSKHELRCCVVLVEGTQEECYSGLKQRVFRVCRLRFDAGTGDGKLRQFCYTLALNHGRSWLGEEL